MLLNSMVIFPNGTLGLWRPWNTVRYNLISLQKDLLFWPCFCSFPCSISVFPFICIFKCLANVQQILTFDLCSLFHFLVFYRATKFNRDLSKWDVGAATTMKESTLQSDLPSKRSTILAMIFLSLFNFHLTLNLYLQIYCQCSANSDFWLLFSFSFSSVWRG